jgi:hypothetical protein
MTRLYTAGDCPVCCFMHSIGLVKNPTSGLLFFYCASCGCCFLNPPVAADGLAEIVEPETYSPAGFVFPDDSDIGEARARGWQIDEMDDCPGSYWDEARRGFDDTGLPVTKKDGR